MIEGLPLRRANHSRQTPVSQRGVWSAALLLRAAAAAVFVLASVTFLITSDIEALVHLPALYDYAIEEHGAAQASGIDQTQLISGAQDLRRYLTDGERLDQITVQVSGNTVPLFSDREQTHLEDVKARLVMVRWAQVLSLVYMLAYALVAMRLLGRRALRTMIHQATLSAIAALAVVGAIGIAVAAGFDQSWDGFHEVIFSNDFWLLNPARDHLIQMFPEAFWEHLVAFLAGVIALQSVALLAVVALARRFERPNDGPSSLAEGHGRAALGR